MLSDKIILHLDMDAFFATVEQAVNPFLREKPIAVASRGKRAVIAAVSYEAKKFGVRAGMPMFKAKKICPDIIATGSSFNRYSEYSKRFFNFLEKEFCNKIEIMSIDECNMDVTNLVVKYNSKMDLMRQIQNKTYQKLGLKVSIGCAWNREIAKIAANLNKPLGLRIILKSELESDIWPLPVESISGVGKVTLRYLKAQNIHTIRDLANESNLRLLHNIFGKNAMYFRNIALGIGTETIELQHPDQKSLSKEHTFENPPSREEGRKFVHELAKNICRRINAQDMVFGVIRVSGKNMRKERFSIQKTLDRKTTAYEDIEYYLDGLFEELYTQHGPLILISFGGARLENQMDYKHKLNEKWTENEIGHDVSSKLNKKLNKRIVMTGSEWLKHRDVSYHDRFLKGEKTKNE